MLDLEELLNLDPKSLQLPLVSELAFDSIGLSSNASTDSLPLDVPSDSLAFQDADLLEDSRWIGRSRIHSNVQHGLVDDDILMVDENGILVDVGTTAQTSIATPQNQSRAGTSHGAMTRKDLGTVSLYLPPGLPAKWI
jgi:hypothetical protein